MSDALQLDFKTARVVIAGIPRAGKTTLAKLLAKREVKIRHTDDLIGELGWSEASAEVATWFNDPGPWIIEGVAAVRALRKWLAACEGRTGTGTPCDVLIWCCTPRVKLSPGQASLAKGCGTVLAGIRHELAAHGVVILDDTSIESTQRTT